MERARLCFMTLYETVKRVRVFRKYRQKRNGNQRRLTPGSIVRGVIEPKSSVIDSIEPK